MSDRELLLDLYPLTPPFTIIDTCGYTDDYQWSSKTFNTIASFETFLREEYRKLFQKLPDQYKESDNPISGEPEQAQLWRPDHHISNLRDLITRLRELSAEVQEESEPMRTLIFIQGTLIN